MWQLIWYVDVNNLLATFLNYFLWLMIHFCKPHVVKFIISLISFIQILVYYLLEVLLIAFISTSFEFFFSKICYRFSIFPKKKSILQSKRNGFFYKEIIILNTS